MLIADGTFVLLEVAAIAALAGGAGALVWIVRAAPPRVRTMPSLTESAAPPAPARRGTGTIARAIAATFTLAGIIALVWLFTSNARVLIVSDPSDGAGRALATQWMRQIGDASIVAHGTELALERPSSGVWVVNASSRPLEVKASGDLDPLAGPVAHTAIAPGAALIVPSVDYLGPGGPPDLIEFLHGGPGPTRTWIDWAE
ncbi:MAG TPA: hypothetical protein VL463_03495 [Kofleriaceae bacterium]|nr:hypothetical protein [Kofleriaceae bacterium]